MTGKLSSEKNYKLKTVLSKRMCSPFLSASAPCLHTLGHQLECPVLTSCRECDGGGDRAGGVSLELGRTQVFMKSSFL